MALFASIAVVELPAFRGVGGEMIEVPVPSRNPTSPVLTTGVVPKFVLVLPHGDPSKLPRDVLSFCFPDADFLAKMPYHYDHSAEEFTFTMTPRDAPRMHGFVRRYRVGFSTAGERLDLSPYSSSKPSDIATPSYQAICILSERYASLFAPCQPLVCCAIPHCVCVCA